MAEVGGAKKRKQSAPRKAFNPVKTASDRQEGARYRQLSQCMDRYEVCSHIYIAHIKMNTLLHLR